MRCNDGSNEKKSHIYSIEKKKTWKDTPIFRNSYYISTKYIILSEDGLHVNVVEFTEQRNTIHQILLLGARKNILVDDYVSLASMFM